LGEKDKLSLLQHLARRHAALLERLSRRLGSTARAADALQDTWLRVGQVATLPEVRDPDAFLLQIAANVAADQSRREQRRRLEPLEIEALLAIPDAAPAPDAVLEGRAELARLQEALAAMPARRRRILTAARLEGLPHAEIAARLGISVRTVAYEIERALDHCSVHLERKPR
jgi:RNA polymerase sigma factor (sigma-70 family)